jgi:hypothetical protein
MTSLGKTWSLADRILPARRSDPALDYCLWPYDAPALSHRDSWQASALLYHSFEVAGLGHKMIDFCDALIAANGPFQTVWGVKYAGGTLSWEFYFYDYARLDRRFDTAAFVAATKDILPTTAPLTGDKTPYFMYSIELTPAHINGTAVIDQFDLYIGNPGSSVSSGICYGLSPAGNEMRNFYFFFNSKQHAVDIRDKIKSTSWIAADELRMDDFIWPNMTPQTTVIANKRNNDSVYFSRIPVAQLTTFLNRLEFCDPLFTFLADNQQRFEHLLFDVGYDWTPDTRGGIRYAKGSYYGLL